MIDATGATQCPVARAQARFIACSMRTRCSRVAWATGGSHGERDAGRWRRLRKFVAADAEYSTGRLTHFADWHRDCGDLVVDVEHNLDSNGQRRRAHPFRARDRRNAAGRHSSDQSVEIAAKAFRADAVAAGKRERAVKRTAHFGGNTVPPI